MIDIGICTMVQVLTVIYLTAERCESVRRSLITAGCQCRGTIAVPNNISIPSRETSNRHSAASGKCHLNVSQCIAVVDIVAVTAHKSAQESVGKRGRQAHCRGICGTIDDGSGISSHKAAGVQVRILVSMDGAVRASDIVSRYGAVFYGPDISSHQNAHVDRPVVLNVAGTAHMVIVRAAFFIGCSENNVFNGSFLPILTDKANVQSIFRCKIDVGDPVASAIIDSPERKISTRDRSLAIRIFILILSYRIIRPIISYVVDIPLLCERTSLCGFCIFVIIQAHHIQMPRGTDRNHLILV